MLEVALYQPDIPQNAATILRMCACLGLRVHVIEPAGFVWSAREFRRAGMDYLAQVEVIRQPGWTSFVDDSGGRRIVLATTHAETAYTDFRFSHADILLLGRESAGVPDSVHRAAGAAVKVPMRAGLRSMNVAVACAMITGEAMRQTAWRRG